MGDTSMWDDYPLGFIPEADSPGPPWKVSMTVQVTRTARTHLTWVKALPLGRVHQFVDGSPV